MAIRGMFGQRSKTAFVLGGGGNLGAIQVGQLRALLERNIVPDVVIGCSVGALNGVAIAANPTVQEVDRLRLLWTGLARGDIFPAGRINRGPWLFMRNGTSAFTDQGLRRLLTFWLRVTKFEDTAIPFWAVATSLGSGLERWFNSGDITTALLASTALPGIFPPVEIDGEQLIDGGVVNNVPISKAIELKAKRIYVLDVGALDRERRPPKRPYEVMMQAVSIARAYRFRIDREHIPDGVEMIRMPIVDPGKMRFDDFAKSADLIERSYKASAAFLDHPAQPIVKSSERRLRSRTG